MRLYDNLISTGMFFEERGVRDHFDLSKLRVTLHYYGAIMQKDVLNRYNT